MSLSLVFWATLFLISVIMVVIYLMKKGKIFIKYSFVWLLPCFLLLICTIAPGFLAWVTKFLGFQTGSNMVFAMLTSLLMIITLALTVIVSNQKNQIRLLVQEISILKERDNKND